MIIVRIYILKERMTAMNLFPDINELIHTENLLSSTTYPYQSKTYCAYCGTQVIDEISYYKKDSVHVRRCVCDDAMEEIIIKSKVMETLETLDAMKYKMDLDRIGNALFEDGVEKLRKRYRPTK
ncbi:hypothetical protein ACFVS2_20665 [Brevibacillus sp. NPDC058079]|uniref:hypothetical protein n=1 Tax=Brevibacillus sp. NPDC058079 TaxID=3346330 RepID=UPI0036E573CC